ncbi:hypothetical protein [Streptomyces oceani]|uniref:DNA primase/polymerase bifunctional N-terminal domain-containing protein n=1 Tax=Streptomyces oceani TaxID=1075402 RepID=A0A1E7JRF9_9ACTN|nr:hypothetical protein [Streptomyces oceani]OEU91377.1 hypothetical protein AN216_24880 [Streptomyces oceani]
MNDDTGDWRHAIDWLVSAAPDPDACRRAWRSDPLGVMLLPAGRLWDVLVVTSGLGPATFDVLTGWLERPGPVLADFGGARVGFFVPPGTSAHWTATGVRGAGLGSWIVVPRPGPVTAGVRWLVPPDGAGTLTNPRVLESALHEAAVRTHGYG